MYGWKCMYLYPNLFLLSNHLFNFIVKWVKIFEFVLSFDNIENQKPFDKISIIIEVEPTNDECLTTLFKTIMLQEWFSFICLFIEHSSKFYYKNFWFNLLIYLYRNKHLNIFTLSMFAIIEHERNFLYDILA